MNDDRRARWSTPTFLIAFAAVLYLLARISLGFLFPLALAASAAVLLSGVNERLVRGMGGRRGLAALLMSVATVLGLLGPLSLILVLLIQAAVPLLERIVMAFRSGQARTLIQWAPESLARIADPEAVRTQLEGALGALAADLAGFVTAVPALMARLAIDGFVTFLALFVYFARGPQLVHAIIEATPMERRHTRALLDTVAAAVRTVFMASFITAVIQFVLGYLGFRLVGVPLALGLAAVMAFFSFIFSLVPVLGSGLVWGPVGVVLLATGRPWAGLFILLWGALVLGSVDNIVKPLYAKEHLQLSPLLVFITLFGGISLFGPIGALLGPLIAALAAAFLRIWTTEFLPDAEPLPKVAGPPRPSRWRRKRKD
jgi:predicted PurR-regulated permease PerM